MIETFPWQEIFPWVHFSLRNIFTDIAIGLTITPTWNTTRRRPPRPIRLGRAVQPDPARQPSNAARHNVSTELSNELWRYSGSVAMAYRRSDPGLLRLRASHRLPTVEGSYSVCISFAVLVAMLVSVYSRLCGCRRNRDCVVNLGRFQRVRPTVERNGHPGGSRHLVWRKKEAIRIEIPRCPSAVYH